MFFDSLTERTQRIILNEMETKIDMIGMRLNSIYMLVSLFLLYMQKE